jgi:uncharacterized membrane protein
MLSMNTRLGTTEIQSRRHNPALGGFKKTNLPLCSVVNLHDVPGHDAIVPLNREHSDCYIRNIRNMPSGTLVMKSNSRAATGEVLLGSSGAALWLWAMVALGAFMRLVALGRKSFWLDEIASVWTSRLSDHAFWAFLWRSEGNMALYYVLLHPWLYFGVSEASVRLLSALLGLASIPVMYGLGKLLFGKSTAHLAALFFALNTCAIAVSQEARGYSLLILGVLVSTYLFVRLVERPSFAMACAYGVVTSLTFYCHYFGLLVPAAQAVSLVALPQERRPWKQSAIAAAIMALGAAPVLWMIHIQDIGHIAWVKRP